MADHNLAITRAARSILRPLGCVQKGRSRLWLDDHGWWIGLVEFQPSGFSKMSYLNVGACFLWVGKSYYSFDLGPDERGSGRPEAATVEDDPDFARSALMLAEAAARDVIRLRARLSDLRAAATALRSALSPLWGDFHRGVAAGLLGDLEGADRSLREACRGDPHIAWHKDLATKAELLRLALSDSVRFKKLVTDAVVRSRSTLRLPERAITFESVADRVR